MSVSLRRAFIPVDRATVDRDREREVLRLWQNPRVPTRWRPTLSTPALSTTTFTLKSIDTDASPGPATAYLEDTLKAEREQAEFSDLPRDYLEVSKVLLETSASLPEPLPLTTEYTAD